MAGELQAPPPPSLQSLEHFLHLRNSTLLQAQRARARARARASPCEVRLEGGSGEFAFKEVRKGTGMGLWGAERLVFVGPTWACACLSNI